MLRRWKMYFEKLMNEENERGKTEEMQRNGGNEDSYEECKEGRWSIAPYLWRYGDI